MKRYLLPIIMLVLTYIISPSIKAEDCGVPIDPTFSNLLSSRFEITPKDICKIIYQITGHVKEAQNYITQIADTDRPEVTYNDKIRSGGLIDTTIDRHYINEDADIQVTSIHSNGLKEYYIKAYLQHLADLSYKGIYNQVKLVFYENQMTLQPEDINEVDKNTTILSIGVFQDFQGCKTVDGEQCYKDLTYKKFWITVNNIKSPKRQIKINSVAAIQTYDWESFHEHNILIPRP